LNLAKNQHDIWLSVLHNYNAISILRKFKSGVVFRNGIEILGSRNCLNEFSTVISFLKSGKFPVNEVITSMGSIENSGQALAEWSVNPGPITKIMVKF